MSPSLWLSQPNDAVQSLLFLLVGRQALRLCYFFWAFIWKTLPHTDKALFALLLYVNLPLRPSRRY